MANEIQTCECGRQYTPEQSSGPTCFACKCQSVGFGFRGPCKPTRRDFHDNTIRSVLAEGDHNIRALGGDPKRDYESTTRWV